MSKTAPTGEYLTVGSFMIRGRKNFLPPHPLVMGFGILFRLDESSLGFHLNERRVRGEDDEFQPSISDSEDLLLGKKGRQSESIKEEEKINGENKTEELQLSSNLEEIIDKALSLGPVKGSNLKEEVILPDSEESGKVFVRGKACLSKAERRKLKKGEAGSSQNHEGAKSDSFVPEKGSNDHNQKPPPQKMTRGQKGKIKKMKEKYADQDDEERKLRMALLAVSNPGFIFLWAYLRFCTSYLVFSKCQSAGKVNPKSEEQQEKEMVPDDRLQETGMCF